MTSFVEPSNEGATMTRTDLPHAADRSERP
jgi:hypothetical protein